MFFKPLRMALFAVCGGFFRVVDFCFCFYSSVFSCLHASVRSFRPKRRRMRACPHPAVKMCALYPRRAAAPVTPAAFCAPFGAGMAPCGGEKKGGNAGMVPCNAERKGVLRGRKFFALYVPISCCARTPPALSFCPLPPSAQKFFARDRHIFAEVCIFKIQDTSCPRSLLRRGVFSPAEKKVKKFDVFFGILRKVYLFYGIIANRRTEECISGIQYGRAAGPSVFACRPREYVRGGSGRGRQRKYFPGTKKGKKLPKLDKRGCFLYNKTQSERKNAKDVRTRVAD